MSRTGFGSLLDRNSLGNSLPQNEILDGAIPRGRLLSKRFLQFLRYITVAILLSVSPMLVAEHVLKDHALQYGNSELRAAAGHYLARADKLISSTLDQLRGLHRSGHVTCLPNDRAAFLRASVQSGYARQIGLLDAGGLPMCSAPELIGKKMALLPPATDSSPMISLSLAPGQYGGAHSVIIGWRIDNGVRLFSYLEPGAIFADFGPEYLRAHRQVVIRVGASSNWLTLGNSQPATANSEDLSVITAQSDRYPVTVEITVPKAAMLQLIETLILILQIGCGLALILFVILSAYFTGLNEPDDQIAQAINNSEFTPYYQPVIDIATGQLAGCEMLCRWVRPDGSVIPPGAFMTYAETSGHIFEITRQLMRKTVDEVGDLYKDAPSLKISVNLFAGHFLDRSVVDDIVEIYGDGPIAFKQVVFEVTERHPLEDLDMARKVIAEIRALGSSVALDDAGTGHGGLAYLQNLGIDIIKIDKMFIDALGTDRSSRAIVDTLIELAGNLGMGVIAEGVETKEQIEALRELGVTTAQGYIFAPPLPAKLYIELAQAVTNGLGTDGSFSNGETDEPVPEETATSSEPDDGQPSAETEDKAA